MPKIVRRRNGNQGTEQPRVDRAGRSATRVQVQREEPDRNVERFARDFVAVDEGAPVSVDRNKTQRARRATEISPVGRSRWSRGGGGEISIWWRGAGHGRLFGKSSSSWLSRRSRKLSGGFGAAATRSRTLLYTGI